MSAIAKVKNFGLALSLFGGGLFAATTAFAESKPVTPRFAITAFEVSGNTLVPSSRIEAALADLLGGGRGFADIQQAVERVERLYRREGYSLLEVELPEQELSAGRVRLLVHERRIGKVVVGGAKHFSEANIRASVPGLREGEIPNMDEISSSLRIANESPAKKTVLQLGAAENNGPVSASLQVTDESPMRFWTTFDNTGLESTGKHRLGISLQHGNLFDRDQVLSMQYTTSLEKPSEVSIYGFGYHIPLYAAGDSIDFFAGRSDVNSGVLSTGGINLNISGRGTVLGLRYNQSLSRLGAFEHRLVYGFDYRAYENDVTFGSLPLGNDVTVRPFSVNYIGKWTLPRAEFSGYLTAVQNLPGGENGDKQAFDAVRSGASSAYGLLRYGASTRWAFAGDWQGGLVFNGQWTRDRLVPGEQFGAGGATSVRGFRERALADDKGAFFSGEVHTPELCTKNWFGDSSCRLVAFYDVANLWRNDPLPGELSRNSIASAGLGLRYSLSRNFSWRLDGARVLDDGGTGGEGKMRFHFLVIASY